MSQYPYLSSGGLNAHRSFFSDYLIGGLGAVAWIALGPVLAPPLLGAVGFSAGGVVAGEFPVIDKLACLI